MGNKSIGTGIQVGNEEEKGEILNLVIQLTGCSRYCATRVPRQRAKPKVMDRPKQNDIQATLIEDERTER